MSEPTTIPDWVRLCIICGFVAGDDDEMEMHFGRKQACCLNCPCPWPHWSACRFCAFESSPSMVAAHERLRHRGADVHAG